jgi:hypothetical protein
MAGYSNEYSSDSVSVLVNGIVITRALGVMWKAKIESEAFYGMGREPLGIADGNKSYEGNVKMHQSQLDKLLQASGNKDLDKLRDVDIEVAYQDPLSGRLSTRTLIGCRINEVSEEYKSGDKFAEIELPFVFTKVKTKQ